MPSLIICSSRDLEVLSHLQDDNGNNLLMIDTDTRLSRVSEIEPPTLTFCKEIMHPHDIPYPSVYMAMAAGQRHGYAPKVFTSKATAGRRKASQRSRSNRRKASR